MHKINISEQLYAHARRAAQKGGFASVDEYISSVVQAEVEWENQDHLFSQEVISELDAISSAVKSGSITYSEDEVDRHLEATKAAWRKKHAS